MPVARLLPAALIAAALVAFPPIAEAAEKVVANGETVRIMEYPGSIGNPVAWAAADKGFCAAHGIKCELTMIPSGPLGLQALAAGSLDVFYASTDVIMMAAAHGNDVQSFLGVFENNPYTLDVRKDLPLPHLAQGYPAVMQDLKGRKIGVTARGAATEVETTALLEGAGLGRNDVTFVAVGSPATAYPAIVAKQIDAAMEFEPFDTLCRAQNTCVAAVDLRTGVGPPSLRVLNGGFGTAAAERSYIKAHPQVIGAYIQAMQEAHAWVEDPKNFDDLARIVRPHVSLGDIPNAEAIFVKLLHESLPRYGTRVDRKSIKGFSDFLLSLKLIAQPIDPKDFVYAKAP